MRRGTKFSYLSGAIVAIALSGCGADVQEPSAPAVSGASQSVVAPPDPGGKTYIHYFQQLSGVANEVWNYQTLPGGTRTVQIAGKRIVLDQADVSGILASLGGTTGATDIKRLDIFTETLVIRKQLRLPGTEVHIHAEQLRFEDVAGAPPALIDTSPVAPPNQANTTDPVPGLNGLPAGHVYVAVHDFFSDQNRTPRFVLNGGNGQRGGPGKNGTNGAAAPRLSDAKPDLITCAGRGMFGPLSFGKPTDPGLTLSELTNQTVNFGAEFPGDGMAAVAGGKPGSGGDAGKLHVSSGPSLAPYMRATPGVAGTFVATYTGGQPGTPNPAIKLQAARCTGYALCGDGWREGNDCGSFGSGSIPPRETRVMLKVTGVTRRSGLFGANASTPRPDRATGATGAVVTDVRTLAWYHPHAVAMTLAFAEDAFATGFRDLTTSELARQDQLLQQLAQSSDWAVLPAEERALFTQHGLRVRSLLNQLISHEDYWGNPQNWVPQLSLEANVALYQQEVQWAIRTIFVSDWLTEKNNAQKNTVAAIEQAKNLLRSEIDLQQTQFDAAAAKLPDLKQDALEASNAIDELATRLAAIEQRLTERAARNVRDRLSLPFWKKALRVLIVAAKALPIPGIQPELGGIATAVDTLIDFDSDKPWDSLPGARDAIKAFAGSDIDQKTKDAKDNAAAQKPGDKTTKPGLLATVSELQKFAQPVVDALKQQKQRFQDQEVKKDDLDKLIAAELEKLKGEDPEYPQLEANVKTVIATRDQLVKAISDATTAVEQANTRISACWLEYSQLLPQVAGQAANIASQRAQMALVELRTRALRRLQKYQYLLSRAYKYRMLREYPGDLTLTNMFNEMVRLVKATGQNGVLQAADYDHLYALYRDDISTIVEAVVDEYSHGQRRYDTISLDYELSQDELARLNAGRPVTLDFWERGAFQPKDEDVRIVKLEVTDMQVDQIGAGDFAYVDLDTAHPGISRVWRDGQVTVFQHYNKSTLQPMHWATRWQNGTLTQFAPSASSESLLRSLIPDATTDIMLFSRPAVWAALAMSKVVHGTNGVDFRVRSARVRLTYDFTAGTSSNTWQAYRDGQNTVLDTTYQGMLRRAASADELGAARQLLDLGYAIDAVSTVIRQSHEQEYFGVRTNAIYDQLYHRIPTDTERAFWAKELMNGRTEAQTTSYVQRITDTYGPEPTLEVLERSTSQLDQGIPPS